MQRSATIASSARWNLVGTLLQAYKVYFEPLITFAAPVWAPNASASSVLRVQLAQSAALRVVTGCHSATRWEYLNQETKVLPVAHKLELLSSQFLASSLRPNHPSYNTVIADAGPRNMKSTLKSKFGDVVEPFLSDGVMGRDDYAPAIKVLHTQFVEKAISDLGENHLLNAQPLEIDEPPRTLYIGTLTIGGVPVFKRLPNESW